MAFEWLSLTSGPLQLSGDMVYGHLVSHLKTPDTRAAAMPEHIPACVEGMNNLTGFHFVFPPMAIFLQPTPVVMTWAIS